MQQCLQDRSTFHLVNTHDRIFGPHPPGLVVGTSQAADYGPAIGITVVIPTWNEADRLPRLLDLVDQSGVAESIVVADNFSTDDTRKIAAAHGCTVVDGGRPGVARNLGAAAAQSTSLLFIDADAVPSTGAFEAVAQLEDGSSVAAHFRHRPISDDPILRAAYRVADFWFVVLAMFRVRHGLASFLWVRVNAFAEVDGFDEGLDPGEDVDFVRRVGRIGVVTHICGDAVAISARRFSTEGRYTFMVKTIWWEMLRLFESRSNHPPYLWVPHNGDSEEEERWLRKEM